MEKETGQRENWGSRFGFIMAAVGFSVGLGSLWRFPYLTGEYGGGAFVFVYLIICVIIGIPLFTQEISLRRKTQLNAVYGMRSLTRKGSAWVLFGWLGIIAAFVILCYYIQIAGWTLAYLIKMLTGQFNGLTEAGHVQVYESFLANPLQVSLYTLICLLTAGYISSRGLKDGIETACKILLPALFAMLIILAIRSLTLPGAIEGLKWYLTVDFSKITAQSILAALGQCFFAVGIASGGAFIYGSYLKKDSNIPGDATLIVLSVAATGFVAGLVIFPALFALGLNPDAGSGVLFVTMSNLFANMPAGNIFGAMFFLLVLFAALSSVMGYLEPIVCVVSETLKMKRKYAVWLCLTVIFIVGFPTILAHGVWSHIIITGRNLFDFADYLSGNIFMPLGALILALYTTFVWKFENYQADTNIGAVGKIKVFNWWSILVKFIIPIAILIIFVTGAF